MIPGWSMLQPVMEVFVLVLKLLIKIIYIKRVNGTFKKLKKKKQFLSKFSEMSKRKNEKFKFKQK